MASRRITIYDLTGDSGDENISQNTLASSKSTITRPPAREPLEVLQNHAKPAPKGISLALKSAIATLSEARVRGELETLCNQHEAARCDLERKLLVKGREVSRYHADSESENEKIEDEESDRDGSNIVNSRRQSQKSISSTLPIAVADDEWTPRYAKCENCKEEFDVTDNEKRWCYWHPGTKLVDYGADFWCDHDENCHGTYESFEDDPEAQEAFTWSCCETTGDNEGCKITKHKAKVNALKAPAPTSILPALSALSKDMNSKAGFCSGITSQETRFPEIAIPDINWTYSGQCGRCPESYDGNNNKGLECFYHTGSKEVDPDADTWCDHDEDSHGPYEKFIDDPDYAGGFVWDCCNGWGDEPGCQEGNHIPKVKVPTETSTAKRKAEEEFSRPATHRRLY